jgi:lipid II:glycine glycyltransferase (peptidoglycan interpeptide bridge formation enzyme)
MAEFLSKVRNYNAYSYYTYDQRNQVSGSLRAIHIREGSGIIGVFSSRVLILGGPLLYSNKTWERIEILDDLLHQLIKEQKNRSVFIQFRNFNQWTNDEKEVFKKYNFEYRERQNILIDLSSKGDVLKGMSESKRRQIRIAKKNGTITRAPNSIEEVCKFYEILKNLYRNQIRKPLPDFSFFREFYNYSDKGLGIMRVVLKDDEIIGGVVAPVTAHETIYYWYVAGLDQKYRDSYPSVMAVWSLIEYGLDNGIKQLDFMGIGKESHDYGVREFKLRFSKNVIDYGRFGRRNNKLLYSFAELGYNFLRIFKRI